ncbi:MAG: hypothetical protein ACNYPE_03460 [Candidatus Azotimanducaceae bacterium WSBS_2022_MAG_OTU7]
MLVSPYLWIFGKRLYQSILRQGPGFFVAISVGDVMTRAIQDISLIQRATLLLPIAIVIMVFVPLFGVSAMLLKLLHSHC